MDRISELTALSRQRELTEEEKRRRSFNPLSGEYTYP